MAGGGISGVAVGVVTAGAILVYAGIKDLTPLDALRSIAGGKTLPAVAGAGASGTPAPATPGSDGKKSGLTPAPDAGHASGGAGGGGGGSW